MVSTKRIALAVLATATLALSPAGVRDADAAGWSSGLLDARSVGMGNAFHALADTPMALHFNPAGLALSGQLLSVQIGVHYPAMLNYSSDIDYTDPVTNQTERNLHESKVVPVIPHLLISTNVLDQFLPKDFHLGLGIGWYVPMGGGTVDFQDMKLDATDPLNISGFRSELAIHYLSVGAAFSWKRLITLGANFNVHFTDVGLKQTNYPKQSALTYSNIYVDNEFSGFGAAFSGSFGLMLQDPNEMFRLGVSYKMKYEANASGTTKFDIPKTKQNEVANKLISQLGVTLPLEGDSEANFYIPHVLMVGVSVTPIERLTVGVSIDWTLWSETEQLVLDWSQLGIPKPAVEAGVIAEEVILPTGYDDVLTVMVGGEFKVLKDNLPIRLGYIYNPAAKFDNANSVASVDTTSHIITFGGGYTVSLPKDMFLDIDLGMYTLIGKKTEVTKEFLTSKDNQDPDTNLNIFAGPSGEYNKTIFFGGILDLTLRM